MTPGKISCGPAGLAGLPLLIFPPENVVPAPEMSLQCDVFGGEDVTYPAVTPSVGSLCAGELSGAATRVTSRDRATVPAQAVWIACQPPLRRVRGTAPGHEQGWAPGGRVPGHHGAGHQGPGTRHQRAGGPGPTGPGDQALRGRAAGAGARAGPGSRGPGSRGPGSRGPGSRGPGSRGPGSRGRAPACTRDKRVRGIGVRFIRWRV